MDQSTTNDRHEFKPLLVEIDERPINPLGRAIFWILIFVLIFAGAWLYFAKIDVVVSARGKVVPSGEIKVLQPIDTGVVSKIFIKEGDFVKKGDILIEIDPSVTESDLSSKKKTLELLKLESNRLEALAQNRPFVPPTSLQHLDQETLKTQTYLYEIQKKHYLQQIAAFNDQLHQLGEEMTATKIEKAKLQALYRTTRQKVARLSSVLDIIAADEYESAKKELIELSKNIRIKDHQLKQLKAKKDELIKQKDLFIQKFRNDILEELTQKRKESAQLEAQIKEIEFKSAKQRIKSPVDGYIGKLMVHTVGGVVTPAQKLVSIVPKKAPLLIKATVLNKDIGFVEKNMEAAIKIDTYNFQKYGMLRGQVIHIADDAIEDEKLGPVYEIYIKPEKYYLEHGSKKLSIQPGMSVTAELKVGKRRVIEFFIYPLIKYFDEGLSVR